MVVRKNVSNAAGQDWNSVQFAVGIILWSAVNAVQKVSLAVQAATEPEKPIVHHAAVQVRSIAQNAGDGGKLAQKNVLCVKEQGTLILFSKWFRIPRILFTGRQSIPNVCSVTGQELQIDTAKSAIKMVRSSARHAKEVGLTAAFAKHAKEKRRLPAHYAMALVRLIVQLATNEA